MTPGHEPSTALDLDFLTLAFEASGDCVKMLALDGTLLAINAGGLSRMGFGPGESPVGTKWTEFCTGEDRATVLQALEGAGRGERRSLRSPASTVTGEMKWWDSTVVPVPGPDGRPDRLLVISRDVTAEHEAARALDRSSRLFQALMEASAEMVWHFDTATGRTERRGYVEFTGKSDDPDDIDGWLAHIHPGDVERSRLTTIAAEATKRPTVFEYRILHKTGEWRWVEDSAAPVLNQDGVATDWVGIVSDIHDRKCAEEALRHSEEHLRLAIDATALGTWDVNLVTDAGVWSPECCNLIGIPASVPFDRELFLASVHPDDRAAADALLRGAAAASDRPVVGVFRLGAPDGPGRWVEAQGRTFFAEDGTPMRRVGTLRDVTDRQRAEQQIWTAAHTDALTGVANRTLFQSRLDKAVAEAAEAGTCVGLLIIDVDRFKDVNDSLGHDAGDALLCAMAQRLRDHVPPAATVARLGGDEFGVIVPANHMADIERLPAWLLTLLKAPVPYADRELDCSASIGWSVFPDHDPAAPALLRHADIALYAVKAAGRGHAQAFTPAMLAEMQRRMTVLRWAKEALIQDAIFPVYQPKVSLQTGMVVGFEALLRWTDDSGLRMPGALQEAFDDRELSVKVGNRMAEKVVADMQAWADAGLPFGHVGLNVATPEFNGRCLGVRLLEALDAAGLKPHHLEVEITERVLLDDGLDVIGKALKTLAAAGVSIALDDFGTGYASLSHLKRFPVSWLKIDRSFVSNMERDSDSVAIVTAVTQMAHSIGIRVVAEGIETVPQLDRLIRIGCDLGQGYLMAKPMVASRVPFLLTHWAGLPGRDRRQATGGGRS